MKYLYPCQPGGRLNIDSEQFAKFDNDERWVAETKRNGWRCLACKDGSKLILYTRRNTMIMDKLPRLREALRTQLPDGTIIDGELMEKRTKNVKELFYAFDILFHMGRPVYNLPWKERRKLLEETITEIPDLIELSVPTIIEKRKLYEDSIKTDEGIVLKLIDSKYPVGNTKGIDNPFWIKVKKPENYQYIKEDDTK